MKGVARTKATEAVRLAAASGSPIHVEGDARLEFVRDGKTCNLKFLDADVKRPVASVCAIVYEGNIVVFGPQESYIVNHEHWPEDSDKQQARRVCGAAGRTSVFEIDGNVRIDEPNMNEMTPVLQAASVNQNVEEIRERCEIKTDNEARKDMCVTRIEEVDDVVREEAEEQRMQDEEEEFGERKTTCLQLLVRQQLQCSGEG